jgi:hypothetical protein
MLAARSTYQSPQFAACNIAAKQVCWSEFSILTDDGSLLVQLASLGYTELLTWACNANK